MIGSLGEENVRRRAQRCVQVAVLAIATSLHAPCDAQQLAARPLVDLSLEELSNIRGISSRLRTSADTDPAGTRNLGNHPDYQWMLRSSTDLDLGITLRNALDESHREWGDNTTSAEIARSVMLTMQWRP